MYKIFLCILTFGLCPIVYGSDNPESHGITVTVRPKGFHNVVLNEFKAGDDNHELLVVRNFFQHQEAKKQVDKLQAEYTFLLRSIKNRQIPDDQLLEILRRQTSSDNDLDDLHNNTQQSLAVALMKVTRPRDVVYQQEGIIKGSDEDKFKNCFRDLGNELFPLDWNESYDPATLAFKGSELEKRLKNQPTEITNNNSTNTTCCALQ